ncbi:MAG TPA: PDZ domain-containing protein [Acidimicrobiia bacterium]
MSTYLRYPHIHDDLITFVAADDVWLAPVEGGRAWRLTDDREPVRTPRFSPDGTAVAFISLRDGHPEAYVIPVDGDGGARRLTWWGAKNTLVLGWTRDGRVLVASHAGEFNLRHTVVKAVGLDGSVERLAYGPAWGVAESDEGAVALSTPGSRPPSHWKRYRGGAAPRLWIDPTGDASWVQLLAGEPASLVDPMWVDGRLVFVSDRAAKLPGTAEEAGEQANLWAFAGGTPDESSQAEQLTDQEAELGYVRDASTDGRRVVWHSRGRIFLLDDLDSEPLEISLTTPGAAPEAFQAKSTKNLSRPRPDHGGDASLIAWRGNGYWLTHREGPARALAVGSGVRVREPVLLGRTGYGVFATDVEGDDALEIQHLSGEEAPRRIAGGELGRVLSMASDSDGDRLAVISHDGSISIVDVESGSVSQIGISPEGEALSPSFSPDGRYLLWSQPIESSLGLHQLMIFDTRSGEDVVPLTSGTFHDHDPAFTFDGKHVVFLSERTFDPEYDPHEFALSFAGSTRPWLIPISASEPAPFGPSAEGWRISSPENDDSKEGEEGEEAEEEASPELDAEGSEERAVPLPVPSGEYRRLSTCKAGILWIEEHREAGVLGTRRAGVKDEPAPDAIQLWSLQKRAVETVADKVSDYAVSGDGRNLVVRYKESVTVTPADRKPKDEKGPSVVKVDLSRLRFEVEPRVEWAQMFDETARLMRDHFWREDMDGVDWDSVVDRWRPVVDSLCSHDDLVDLLWETVAELNTSHAYVIPTEPPGDQKRRLGLLGADLSPAGDGWRIDRILPGESSDPAARSPLRGAGVDAHEGDLIVAVDGNPVDPNVGPARHLIGAAGKPIELTLRRNGDDRRVVVVPIDDEEVLRYQDWVRSRRDYVDEHSEGRLGYVHVPDMTSTGWAQLHRDWRHATEREGVIVDVRYNRGGHTSQLVLARLSKKLVGWTIARHYQSAGSYPVSAPRGPVVLVANEYSGSDGDIINAASQAVGLDGVVGRRTWGGVVGIDGRYSLVDGTSVTQPRYAFWLEGKDWGVENHGVDPDIEVIHSPADFFSDADPQLDRAMEEALSILETRPALTEPPLPEPKVRR